MDDFKKQISEDVLNTLTMEDLWKSPGLKKFVQDRYPRAYVTITEPMREFGLYGVFKIDDSDDGDVNNDVSLGLDLMLFGNEEASFGIGGEYQTERGLDIENSRGKFYFIPAYCVIRMKSQQANIIGKVGLSYFFADNDFTGQSYSNNFRASFKESLYYAAGLSISITNTIGIQVLWSRSTAEIIYDEFNTSVDVGYDKISIGFSLDADN